MSTATNALARLGHEYVKAGPNSFALFLGAGVNLPAGDVPIKFKTFSWPQLLEDLYSKNAHLYDRTFAEFTSAYADDWPGLAEALIGDLPSDEVLGQLDQIIYDSALPRDDRRGRLSRDMLKQAPNLHAAISFSAQIKKRNPNSWTFKRNPKIGAVITTNYDFFFGAGWTCYQAFRRQWKIHTPTSNKPAPEHGAVYYIHGYLPYRVKEKRQEIVLTETSYKIFYAPGAFAREVLKLVLGKYQLLFIGFSFNDFMVCELLSELKGKVARQHFAFVDEKAASRAEALGIAPIVVENWDEIARKLEEIYCASLPSDWQSLGFNRKEDYWERLKTGPR